MTRCEPLHLAAAAAIAGLSLLLARVPAAQAQAEDQAAARALFEQGRTLLKAGQYAEACPKLEAARKLYISAGILLNLADCHEKIGRTASAWTEFGEAATVAKRTNRDADAEEATRRQAALEPKLAHLTISVPHPVPGLAIKRGDAPIAPAAWSASLPVDPGTHEIRAEAAGFETWTKTIEVPAAGESVSVEIPELRASPGAESSAPGATPTLTASAAPATAPPRMLPWALIGGGGAVAISGGVLMLVEANKASEARTNNDPAAWDATKTPWTIGLVGVISGGATAAAGAVLLALHAQESASPPAVSLWWGGGSQGGLSLAGRW